MAQMPLLREPEARGERRAGARPTHRHLHGITSAGSELFEIVADGDIVRLQAKVDFCRKNDAASSTGGIFSVTDLLLLVPRCRTPLAPGSSLRASTPGRRWRAIACSTPRKDSTLHVRSFATGLCAAKVLRVQRKVPCLQGCRRSPSKAACEKHLPLLRLLGRLAPGVPLLPGLLRCHRHRHGRGGRAEPGTSGHEDAPPMPGLCVEVLIDRGTNRRPYDSHPEAGGFDDLDQWSHGWCIMAPWAARKVPPHPSVLVPPPLLYSRL